MRRVSASVWRIQVLVLAAGCLLGSAHIAAKKPPASAPNLVLVEFPGFLSRVHALPESVTIESGDESWTLLFESTPKGHIRLLVVRHGETTELILPTELKKSTISYKGIITHDNGAIIVVGNEHKNDAMIPTMWIHRKDGPPDSWEHWPLRRELAEKPHRKRINLLRTRSRFRS